MSELPQGWKEVRLRDIIKPRKNKIIPSQIPDAPFIGLEHVEAHTGQLLGTARTGDMKSAVNLFEPGDILYSRLRPYLNKVIKADFAGTASAEFIVLPSNQNIDGQFLQYILMHETFVTFASHINQGDRPRVDFEQISSFKFMLPPLEEQRRIVAKLDVLLGRNKVGRQELTAATQLIKRQRQAVLAQAFSGKLTADWREERGIEYRDWQHSTLGNLASVGTGATPNKSNPAYYENGSIPWVTSTVVNNSIVMAAEKLITPLALSETNCKVFPKGTILMAMYGEGKTRGQVSVLGIDAATNQALAAISVNQHAQVIQDFIVWFLRSNYLNLRQQAAGGVQPNLNLSIIKGISILLPSLDEQREIVRRIEAAFARIDEGEQAIKQAFTLAERLEQATLAKAFRGEL
jgi:type I restriction enzyme S subunit